MLSYMRACIDDYQMIQPGDKIAVGVSGGKDSLTLLYILSELRRFYPKPFELIAVTIDMGFTGTDFGPVSRFCEMLKVPYIIKETQIAQVVFDERKEQNPCSLCANMRRGAVNNAAKEAGCNKVALGHSFDDAVETFALSLFFEGRVSCFMPETYLSRIDLQVIRPMLYIHERTIKNFASRHSLPIVASTCPVDKKTKREEIKDLLFELEGRYPGLRNRIFGAMQRYPLHGWGKHTAE